MDISTGRDPFVSFVCIHNITNINNCEGVTDDAHYSMMFLQQYELVLVNVCVLEI